MRDPRFDYIRFIPHGMTCEADESFPDCVARCGEPAVDTITDDRGIERYVCRRHYRGWVFTPVGDPAEEQP